MTGRLNPSRETKFSGANGDREIFIFLVQLTTSRIDNLTRLIHSLLYMSVGGGGGGYAARLFLLFSFPCSADHERDWPPCKVVFSGWQPIR